MTPEGLAIENLLRIADKEGRDVDFRLNSAQRALDEGLSTRTLVPKARQEGVSSYFLARGLVHCLGRNNFNSVVISHDQESTQRMLQKVRYFIQNMKLSKKPEIKHDSSSVISFPKRNSQFYIGTAGSRKFGRGDTIHFLHCSEFAYWPDPATLMAGLLQAVPRSGEIALESTGNGFNDYYHRCMRAQRGESNWKCHFLPWHTFPEYTEALTPSEAKAFMAHLDESLEEPALAGTLTPGQLAWRRFKLEEMNFDLGLFKQEYPMSLDECFRASGDTIFNRVLYQPTEAWREVETGYWRLDRHPDSSYTYVVGADVAGGVGKDYSTVEVFCLDTQEQVAEWQGNRVDPEAFASTLAAIGKEFGEAYIVPEQNNHGLLTVAVLRRHYPASSIYTEEGRLGKYDSKQLLKTGFKTTRRTKPLMVGRLKTLLAHDLTIHSPSLRAELSTFVEHEDGTLGAQAGCHDDLVMGAACAAMGLEVAGLRSSWKEPSKVRYDPRVDPASFAGAIESLERGEDHLPIRSHLETRSLH